MTGDNASAPQHTVPASADEAGLRSIAKVYFAIVGAIGLLTGVVLLAVPGGTGDYFPWQITTLQHAIFMGAGYLGTGITLFILLFMGRTWSDVRLIIPPIAVFASVMIITTLAHADRFRWDRAVTWVWISLYFVILIGAMGLALAHRGRARASAPLTNGERVAIFLVGTMTTAWALSLYILPAVGETLWPWALTPLNGRVAAGWIAVAGALALAAGSANDSRSLRLPVLGWTITVVLFLLTSIGVLLAGLNDPRALVYFGSLALSVIGSVWLLGRIQRRLTA